MQYQSNRYSLVVAALLALGGGLLVWWLWPYVRALDVENAVAMIRSWGAWGMLGSIGVMVAHSFLPFPSEIIAIANGMVFGPLWGSVITWVGAMLGASAAFALARVLGRPFVLRMLPARHRRQLAYWSRERGGMALLIGRLIPVIAFNLINYAAALTEISWWTFLWATGIGILPLTILLNVLGDGMLSMPPRAWLLIGAAAAMIWLFLHLRWRAISPSDGSTHDGSDGVQE